MKETNFEFAFFLYSTVFFFSLWGCNNNNASKTVIVSDFLRLPFPPQKQKWLGSFGLQAKRSILMAKDWTQF